MYCTCGNARETVAITAVFLYAVNPSQDPHGTVAAIHPHTCGKPRLTSPLSHSCITLISGTYLDYFTKSGIQSRSLAQCHETIWEDIDIVLIQLQQCILQFILNIRLFTVNAYSRVSEWFLY